MSNSTFESSLSLMCNAAFALLPNWVVKYGIPILFVVGTIYVIFSLVFYSSPSVKVKKSSNINNDKEVEEEKGTDDTRRRVGGAEGEKSSSEPVDFTEEAGESTSIPSGEGEKDEGKDERVADKIMMLEELPQNISHIKDIYLSGVTHISEIFSSSFSQTMSDIDDYTVTLSVCHICTMLRTSMKKLRKGSDLTPLRNVVSSLKEIVDEWEEINKRPIVTIFSFIGNLVSLGKLCSDIRNFISEADKVKDDVREQREVSIEYWKEMSDITSSLETLSVRKVHVSLEFSPSENEAIMTELKDSLSSGVMSPTSQYLYILHNIGG